MQRISKQNKVYINIIFYEFIYLINLELFQMKKFARRILWEVSQRCQENGFHIDDTAILYNVRVNCLYF